MADIVRRRSWGGVLPLGRQASISGSSLIQSVSVSMAPPHPGWANCYPGAEVQGRTGPRLGPISRESIQNRGVLMGVGLGSGLTGRGWAGAEAGVAGEAGCRAAT